MLPVLQLYSIISFIYYDIIVQLKIVGISYLCETKLRLSISNLTSFFLLFLQPPNPSNDRSITVKTYNGTSISLKLQFNAYVDDIIQVLSDKGYRRNTYRLLSGRYELREGKQLKDYYIPLECQVNMVENPKICRGG